MSDFKVQIVKLGPVNRHPNADVLGFTVVFGQPCIFNLASNWSEGDLAIFVPVEAVVPLDRPYFSWLKKPDSDAKTHRVKAVRLRGLYSEGFLIRPSDCFDSRSVLTEGQDVTEDLGVVKYEEPENIVMGGENEKDPGFMPHYDVEPYFKYKHLLLDNEEVIVTEKIHGCNARFCFKDGRLWVGSHGCVKRESENNLFWKTAKEYDLDFYLARHEGLVFFGEIYGQVQDLKYSVVKGTMLKFFDIYDTKIKAFLDYDEMQEICAQKEYAHPLPTVPVLYRGPLDRNVVEGLRTGKSVLDNKTIREGVIVRPVKERWNYETGRTLLKIVSEEYKLRKKGTEYK
jgi:RNA ligase (TIGR02306 family)